MKRKIYKISRSGSLKNLHLTEDDLSEPSADEVQIKTRSIGLNFADIFAMTGLYSATPDGPFIPGLEFAGIITKAGSGVIGFVPGDAVMGVIRFGAYSNHLNISYKYIIPLPKTWSFSEGAAFPVNYLTAYYALVVLGNIKKDHRVLIHSAAGGVGILANRIAKRMGAVTVGTIGDENKRKTLALEPYDKIIFRSKRLKNDLAQNISGNQYDLVLDAIGGKVFRTSYDLLAPQGRIITYGAATFTPVRDRPNYARLIYKYLNRPQIDPLELVSANRSVMGFNLIWLWDKIAEFSSIMEKAQEMEIGKPLVGRTFSFSDLPEAIRFLRSGKSIGKNVVDLE